MIGLGGTIRRRVARILALPAVVVLALLGVVAAGQIQGYRSSQATAESVRLALAVQNLVHELQTERGITAGVLGGNPSFRNELGPARQLVNRQRAAVESLVSGDGSGHSEVRSAVSQLDGLEAVRAATDAGSAARQATFSYFTDRITALAAVDVGLDRTSDDELRRGAQALQSLQDLSEALAQERAFLNGVFSAGGFARGEFVQFASMRAAKEAALDRFDRFATASEKQAADFVFATGAGRITGYFEQVAVDAADGRHVVVNPQSWWSGLTTVLDDMRQLQQHVGSLIQVRAHDLQQASAQRIAALLVVVVLTFAGSIYLAAVASMSITRPLAAMAFEANSVAVERLPSAVSRVQAGAPGETPPEPPAPVKIPARATSEIRSVATALDRLQSAAYGLAIDQALQRRRTIESLANLGRRNQNLIRRQLGFITALEHEEIDPSALANLFELDHLATRMRRNAASLLVLVGASSPRQWSTPVPLADVIRAAVSEVEEYRRVVLRRVDDALVVGAAVGSVAHLLSELIENGLTFSPPDSEVEVQGRRLVDGYLIAITDQGVGMSTEDLRQANGRLRGEEDFIAAPTRFLGHFVVGQLARETGAEVELLPSPVTGVTARVTLPQSVLASSLAVGAGEASRHVAGRPSSPVQLTAVPTSPALESGPIPLPVTGPQPILPAAAAVQQPAAISLVPPPPEDLDATRLIRPIARPAASAMSGAPTAPAAPAAAMAEDPGAAGPRLPAAVTSMLGSHPLVHPFAGDLTVTAPNDVYPPRPPAAAAGTPAAPGRGQGYPPPTGAPGQPVNPQHRPPAAPPPSAPPGAPPISASGTRLVNGGDDEAARTRNGLRKRMPREQRATVSAGASQPTRRVIDLTAAARPTVDDSPAEVRARLTALRAGIQRGQVSGPTTRAHAGSDHVVED